MNGKDLLFMIPVWKRPEVEKLVIEQLKKKQKKYGFTILVGGSEGEKSKALAEGCEYVEVPNTPISTKNNLIMQKAKEYEPKGVVILGSDNFVNNAVIDYYYKLIESGNKNVQGFEDLYFFDTLTTKLSHFDTGQKSYGAGRFYPAYALDKVNWKAWKGELNRGLDNNSRMYLEAHGIKFEAVRLDSIKGMLLDIKHKVNISSRDIVHAGKEVPLSTLHKAGIRIKSDLDKLCAVWDAERKAKEEYIKKLETEMKLPEDMAKEYWIEGTGLSKHMPKGERYKVHGFQARRLIMMKRAVLC